MGIPCAPDCAWLYFVFHIPFPDPDAIQNKNQWGKMEIAKREMSNASECRRGEEP